MAAALTVAVGMGIYDSADEMDDLIGIGKVVEPDERIRPRYEELYGVYREIYSALVPIHRRLSKIE